MREGKRLQEEREGEKRGEKRGDKGQRETIGQREREEGKEGIREGKRLQEERGEESGGK